MSYYVYIIKSVQNGIYYYGQTQDLQLRIAYHNKGYSRYTKNFMPWMLYAYKKLDSRAEAMITEKKLKNLRSRDRVAVFIKKNGFIIP